MFCAEAVFSNIKFTLKKHKAVKQITKTVFKFISLFIGFFCLVLVKNLCNGAKPVILLNYSIYLLRITGLLFAVE